MTWKYGLLKTQFDKPLKYNWFELIEIYSENGYAKDIQISGESIEETIEILETALSDLRNNLTVISESQ